MAEQVKGRGNTGSVRGAESTLLAPIDKPTNSNAKYAYKRLVRRNGKWVVAYFDSQTGAEISSLDGYTLASADGSQWQGDVPGPSGNGEQAPEDDGRGAIGPGASSGETRENFWEGEWATDPNRSKGTGNIIGDLQAAGDNLNSKWDEAKGWLFGAVGGLVAPIIGQKAGEEIRNNAPELVQGAKAAVGDAANNVGNAVGNLWNNITGGGGNSGPVNTAEYKPPTELISYAPIATRTIPVSEQYATMLSAAVQSVDPNLSVVITSGGQPQGIYRDGKRVGVTPYTDANGHVHNEATGSDRHDIDENGNAMTADVKLFMDGKELSPRRDPELFAEVVKASAAVGFTGIGVSENKGFLHIGGGPVNYWGYGPNGEGKKDFAPSWLEGAFSQGVNLNKQGEGERILEAYVEATIAPEVDKQIAANMPQPIKPEVADLVNTLREARGERPAEPLFAGNNTTNMSGPLDVAMSTRNQGVPTPVLSLSGDANLRGGEQDYSTFTPQLAYNEQGMPQYSLGQGNTDLASNKMVGSDALTAINNAAPQNNTPASNMMNAYVGPTTEVPNSTFRESLTPVQQAFLDTLQVAEGARDYNVLFGDTANKPKTFDSYSAHPRVYNSQFDTTAAGAYQITLTTYNDFAKRLGITDFTPESQDKIALAIAEYEYGKDVWEALEQGKYTEVATALNGRWTSLAGGSQERLGMDGFSSTFQSSLDKYTTPTWSGQSASKFKDNNPVISETNTMSYIQKNDEKLASINATKEAQKQALSTGSSMMTDTIAPITKIKNTSPVSGGLGQSGSGSSGGISSGGIGLGGSSTNKVKNTQTNTNNNTGGLGSSGSGTSGTGTTGGIGGTSPTTKVKDTTTTTKVKDTSGTTTKDKDKSKDKDK